MMALILFGQIQNLHNEEIHIRKILENIRYHMKIDDSYWIGARYPGSTVIKPAVKSEDVVHSGSFSAPGLVSRFGISIPYHDRPDIIH